jgi:hypothetical protein
VVTEPARHDDNNNPDNLGQPATDSEGEEGEEGEEELY